MPVFDIKESRAFAEDQNLPREVYRGFFVTSAHSRIISRKKSSSEARRGEAIAISLCCLGATRYKIIYFAFFFPPLIARKLNRRVKEVEGRMAIVGRFPSV